MCNQTQFCAFLCLSDTLTSAQQILSLFSFQNTKKVKAQAEKSLELQMLISSIPVKWYNAEGQKLKQIKNKYIHFKLYLNLVWPQYKLHTKILYVY